MNSVRASARNPTADIARALAALLIIAGHALVFAAMPQHWLASLSHLATPMFFFLSGAFISLRRPLHEWLRTRLDALLKPYIVVLLGWAVVHDVTGVLDWSSYLAGMLYGTGATIVILPLWFLPHLLLVISCAQLLLRAVKRWRVDERWYWLLLLLPLLAKPLLQAGWPQEGLPFSADLLVLSLPLVFAGHLLANCVRQFVPSLPVCVVAIAAVWVAAKYGAAAIDMNRRLWGSPLATMLMVAAGLYVMQCLAVWLSKIASISKALAWFGRYTLLVLLFHFLWLRWLFRLLREQGIVMNEGWVVVAVVACVLLCCVTIVIVQRSNVLSRCLLPLPHNRSAIA